MILSEVPYINRPDPFGSRPERAMVAPQQGKATAPDMPRYRNEGPGFLSYLLRFVLVLLVLAGLGLVAFAYVGDLAVTPLPQSVPVTPLGG